LGLLVTGCGGSFAFRSWNPFTWWREPPVVVIPWDSVSPPSLAVGLDSLEPPPIDVGRVPPSGRYAQDLDVIHYDIEIVIPVENDRVSSRTTVRYTREEAGPHSASLDFTGQSVELVTDRGLPLPFSQEDGVLRFETPGRFGVFDTIQVEIMARGIPDDGLILGRNIHGAPTAFADNWPNRARFWFPSNDHPSDKATVSFTVHAPAGRRVVANGEQVSGPVPADSARVAGLDSLETWRWASSVPIPTYLMVVGVGPLEVVRQGLAACGAAPESSRPDGCVEVTAWAFPEDTAYAREAFSRVPQMVDLYADLFGPYPFEKLANVQSSTRFGGMENASVIFYSEQAIAARADMEGTAAHEVVHQWFGNSVTPADWPHLWLSEGFASYFGALFWAQTQDDAAFRERIDAMRARYLASATTDRPVVDEGVSNLLELLNENSYEKGALVLHMLRGVVGERAFFAAIREFYRRYQGGLVETVNLQQVMEEVSGQPLGWFFDQWLRRPGHPVLRVDWTWRQDLSQAQVTVTQLQDPLWPTFRMPVDIEFVMEGGVHRVSDWVDGRVWRGAFALPGRPTELRLDPDGWLILEEVNTP
jgi:aminopeptidase N